MLHYAITKKKKKIKGHLPAYSEQMIRYNYYNTTLVHFVFINPIINSKKVQLHVPHVCAPTS